METCINHPDKKAEYVCYSCKKHYCELCITESGDYYYCKDPNCQIILSRSEAEITSLSTVNPIFIENDERKSRMVHCPECES
jgi:hypothetical protein